MIKRISPLTGLARRAGLFDPTSTPPETPGNQEKPPAFAPAPQEPEVAADRANGSAYAPPEVAVPEADDVAGRHEQQARRPAEPAPQAPRAAAPAPTAKPAGADAAAPAPAAPPAPVLTPSAKPAVAPAETGRRSSRVKTTFLGFDRSDGNSENIFDDPASKNDSAIAMFPVGWLVITDGPGRGTSLTLHDGVSQIGRGDDQAIQLDFGDSSISRSNHAAIAFDEETRAFYLGYGGKSNIVRRNGKPVLATESLEDGDLIRIGETTLRFVAFCGQAFSWTDTADT